MNRTATAAAGCALVRDLLIATLACFVGLSPVCGAEPTSAEDSSPEHQKTPQKLVAALDDSDVTWSVDEIGRPHVSLHNEAAEIAKLNSPLFQELLAAARDPDRFIAALVVLNEVIAKDHWFGAFPGDEGWELDYQGLEVHINLKDGLPALEYPRRTEQFESLTWAWGFNSAWMYYPDGVDSRSLTSYYIAQRHSSDQRESPGTRLCGRTREGLEQLSNADVVWETGGFMGGRPVLRGKSADAAAKPLSIEGLLDALRDPQCFVAAHVILTREFQINRRCTKLKPDGYRILFNGLYAEWTHRQDGDETDTWDATYPDIESQRRRLLKQWDATAVKVP